MFSWLITRNREVWSDHGRTFVTNKTIGQPLVSRYVVLKTFSFERRTLYTGVSYVKTLDYKGPNKFIITTTIL